MTNLDQRARDAAMQIEFCPRCDLSVGDVCTHTRAAEDSLAFSSRVIAKAMRAEVVLALGPLIECDHLGEPLGEAETHTFDWSDFVGRNIWNPMHPKCEKCGLTVGEILSALRALAAEYRESAQGESDG